MIPFKNEQDVVQIGELTIENRTDRLVMFGSIDLTRDDAGLANIRKIGNLLKEAENILMAERQAGKLPKLVSVTEPETVANPFAPLKP